MTVDVTDPRVPILVRRSGKKEAEKSGVIMMPDTANENLEDHRRHLLARSSLSISSASSWYSFSSDT
jgi:hypothetical protein